MNNMSEQKPSKIFVIAVNHIFLFGLDTDGRVWRKLILTAHQEQWELVG